MTQKERVARFRRLHESGPLVLPSVWDAASVRVTERAGAPAIGATSAGISWFERSSGGRWLGPTQQGHHVLRGDAGGRVESAVARAVVPQHRHRQRHHLRGLVNVRTDGNTILCATRNESENGWNMRTFASRF